MKIYTEVTVRRFNPKFPTDGGLDDSVFDELSLVFSEHINRAKTRIKVEGNESDPLVLKLQSCLNEREIRIPERYEKGRAVIVRKYKEFSDDEIKSATLLEPFSLGPDLVECEWRNRPDSPWEIRKVKSLQDTVGHIWAYANQLVTTRNCLDSLTSYDLCHFSPIELTGSPEVAGQFFLVWSDIEMPPVENKLFTNEGRIIDSDAMESMTHGGCLLLDGHFVTPQLRYSKRKLDEITEFDIALSREAFGISSIRNRSIVVSQRFRECCEKIGAKISWIPVLVE